LGGRGIRARAVGRGEGGIGASGLKGGWECHRSRLQLPPAGARAGVQPGVARRGAAGGRCGEGGGGESSAENSNA
jgi:hypothetical protein